MLIGESFGRLSGSSFLINVLPIQCCHIRLLYFAGFPSVTTSQKSLTSLVPSRTVVLLLGLSVGGSLNKQNDVGEKIITSAIIKFLPTPLCQHTKILSTLLCQNAIFIMACELPTLSVNVLYKYEYIYFPTLISDMKQKSFFRLRFETIILT